MAKTKVSEWSSTPGSNTEIDNINISEGCAPSGINDAIREMMAQIKDWQAGVSGDPSVLSQGVMENLASASTTDIGAQNTNFLRITGNTTITSFGTNYRGPRFLVFEGAVTLTNSSTLVLPGGANITTAAGDVLIAIPGATLGTADKWIVVTYQKANTSPGYANIPGGFGFRNRIINGDMRIDQRNAGASVTVNSPTFTYSVDRWRLTGQTTDGVFTGQRSTVAPNGFSNSLFVTVTTADASIGTGQAYLISQQIEGFNVADLDFGTASASSVTLSFWVRSSITGTFGGSLMNGDSNYSYPFTFTISAANTFEYKTITMSGATAGTWIKDNGNGLRVWFSLGSGASLLGSAGSWSANAYYGATGQTNLIATNGATFYITGVQLEAGTVASPFERRDYGRELMMCQRYYYQINFTAAKELFNGQAYATGSVFGKVLDLPVTMRSTPTVTLIGALSPSNSVGVQQASFSGISITGVNANTITTGSLTGSSGLVAGNASVVYISAGGSISCSTEL